jgi:alanine-glyoxylate transaminase/serine-glyoxylate transaminase/serine-pyruvate transaminase
VDPRVLKALATPLIGHLDPEFLAIMDRIKSMLQWLFQTRNDLTFTVAATGSAGMETVLVNLLEEGDEALVCVNGVFGERMCDIVERARGKLIRLDAPWGRIIEPAEVKKALATCKAKLVAIVHAETSTGIWQPLEEIGRLAHEHGALFVTDHVTALGGCEVKVDEWGIDAAYSGTQKCLSCPPGLAPVTFSSNAVKKIEARKTRVQSWYLDMTMVRKYWGQERFYHHTGPISMIYALYESLRIIEAEGLAARFARHQLNHAALMAGLAAMGLLPFAQEGHRLWMLNAVTIPPGIDDLEVRKHLLREYGIEIGGGLGAVKGKIWRIGLMGHSCQRKNVILLLSALESILARKGHKFPLGEAVARAAAVYAGT